ncbi:raqprd family integrative conjugative element protein [Pseudomonas sp. TNT2022 ID357]|uniref:Raqprd family integrative conjugative element protein n=1 Tax=Pseudomonas idahonensis TaxID=2942628 RepID=A0ABT5Q3P3_9PSED|nr:RAQPRD family integrative conjugative element protein [Pseudomonas idahonensis]MDD1148818.1 raqprd family integrative conjugative element protein [Pseudomonas idahonensis]
MKLISKQSLILSRALSAFVFMAMLIAQPANASEIPTEPELLTALLRQLALADRLAKQSADSAPQERSRYHFDYQRLSADLQRIQVGVHNYLTPQRAQPRDADALLGEYRQEAKREVIK